jgi:hypothetical protein
VIESGGKVRFGWHDDVHTFTQRVGYLKRVWLGNLRSDEGVSLGVSFGDRVELIIVGYFFFRIAPVFRVAIALGLVVRGVRTARTIPGGLSIGFDVRLGERADMGGRITCAGTAEVEGRHAPRAQRGRGIVLTDAGSR